MSRVLLIAQKLRCGERGFSRWTNGKKILWF